MGRRRATGGGRRRMRVAIAGAGSVGTAIARDLAADGHEVLLFEQDPELVERGRHDLDIKWVVADACEVASLDAAGLAHRRRGGRRHRGRRGQPGGVPAGQAGIRRAAGGGPGRPPEEPVALHRDLGGRRLGLDPPAADRPGRGGRFGRLAGPPPAVRGGHGPPGRGHPGRRLARRRVALADLASPGTPPSWPWSGPTAWSSRGGHRAGPRRRGIGPRHRGRRGRRTAVCWSGPEDHERRRFSTWTRRSSPGRRSPPSAAPSTVVA